MGIRGLFPSTFLLSEGAGLKTPIKIKIHAISNAHQNIAIITILDAIHFLETISSVLKEVTVRYV